MTAEPVAQTPAVSEELERRAVDVIRGLSMDAVQKANSGHPGTPMALAPLAHVLFSRILRYDAADADWPDRDRFVLSAGHASMLLYSMLYLTGYGLELDDLKEFRQWGSRTAGHPERGHAPGIEVTTGPLGQGFGNGVGIAIVERHLRERFGEDVCNHRSIDGPTELSYSDDVRSRFEGYHWHVVQLGEVAEDLDALEHGLREGMAVEDRPTLLILRSHIGYPSPKYTDTAHAHGSPLGADEVAKVKEILGMPQEDFWVPDDVLSYYRQAGARGRPQREAWRERVTAFKTRDAGKGEEFDLMISARSREGWEAKLPTWDAGESVATRKACSATLDAILEVVPGLIGGGADLTGNTGTELKGQAQITRDDFTGRQLHFGVREHGMGSIMNGMAVSGEIGRAH